MSVLELRSETITIQKELSKNEQLAANKQSSEQTRQIFSKKFAWINKQTKKKDGHTFQRQYWAMAIYNHILFIQPYPFTNYKYAIVNS